LEHVAGDLGLIFALALPGDMAFL